MKYQKQQFGFTIIELLIIIVIIGVISTIITVAMEDSRIKARDSRRMQDVKQLHSTIEYYRRMHGAYPDYVTPGQSLTNPDSGEYYLEVIPEPPGKTDVYCQTDTYTYTKHDYNNFSIDYCLGFGTEDFGPGNHTATKHSLSFNCGGQRPPAVLSGGECVAASEIYGAAHFDGAVENYASAIGGTMSNEGASLVSEGKFGGSVYFDGDYAGGASDANRVKFDGSNTWEFGSNDFSIDFWFKHDREESEFGSVMGRVPDSWACDHIDWNIQITNSAHDWFPNSLYFTYTTDDCSGDQGDGTASQYVSKDGVNYGAYIEMGEFSTDKFDHFAIVRVGNMLYGFKNGVLHESEDISANPTFRDVSNFYTVIGSKWSGYADGTTKTTKGWVDEVRIMIGDSVWGPGDPGWPDNIVPPNHRP